MDSKKIFVTKEGLEELTKELADLNGVKRNEVVERVARAREMGDLSENSEYHAAKEELSLIDGRIDELSALLKNASIIEKSSSGKSGKVNLGSKITVSIDGKKEIFTLVGEWEADPREKKISHESPLGKALIGKEIGEKVDIEAPAGKISYKIVEIN